MLAADIAVRMAEALGHDRRQVLGGLGNPSAGANRISVRARCRLRLGALLQGAGGAHDELAEFDDAEVGWTEMLARAVLDRALAVLDRRILLRHAGDAGEARSLLQCPVDQIIVPLVA